MTAFAEVDRLDDTMHQILGVLDFDGYGPPAPTPPSNDRFNYFRVERDDYWINPPSPTAIRKWNGGDPVWFEPLQKAAALDCIDAAGEALRLAVVNRMTMQTEEYRRAEAQARAWRAAGYPEGEGIDVPRGVTGWAMAKWRDGWTNRQAADDILATAEGWMEILDTIRDLRLANKEDVRNATTPEEVAAICNDMQADMRAMAQQFNLTLTE